MRADEPTSDIALPPIETAASDERGRITVNGRPFFPILMYDVPIDADSLRMFREHGFNVLSAGAEDAETLRKHGFYAAAHRRFAMDLTGRRVIRRRMDSPALYWKDDLLQKAKADLAKMQQVFPSPPDLPRHRYWEDVTGGRFLQ